MEKLQMIEKKNDNIFVRFINKLKSIFKIRIKSENNSNKENELEMILFDLDGTLWSTDDTTLKSTNEYLKLNNIDLEVSMDTVQKTMGCTFKDAAYNYFPSLDEERREELFAEVLDYNNKRILDFGGNIYTNVQSTLEKLKENYKLAIVSNCADGYIEAFLEYSNYGKYFDDFIAASKEKVSKADAIKMVIERNDIKNAIYVGDTDKDMLAAEGAGIEFVQALYGFGDDLNTEYSINDFEKLPELLNTINN